MQQHSVFGSILITPAFLKVGFFPLRRFRKVICFHALCMLMDVWSKDLAYEDYPT